MRSHLSTGLLAACLTACSGTSGPPPEANMEPCQAIRSLADSYKRQFADMRQSKRSYNRIDIWSTRFQVVGHHCEIWGWQGGNYNYVCNYVAPNHEVANDTYEQARTTISQCLGDSWELTETPRQQGAGKQTLFKLAGFAAVVDLRLVETRGISTPNWAVYLMVGDFNDQL